MFYNHDFECCYDELITYYPVFYRDVREMRAILSAHGKISDDLQANIEQIVANSFIDSADEATITRLEAFLNLGLYKTRPLEERRRLVKSFFVGFGKVSASMLKEMVASYTNADVDIYFEAGDKTGNNFLYINFERGKESTLYMSDIEILLSKKVPAHLKYRTAVIYRYAVGVEARHSAYKNDYELCGTKPDTALLGVAVGQISVVKERHANYKGEYEHASESAETGSQPMRTLIGHNDKISAETAVTSADYSVDYIPCGTIFSRS